MRQRRALTLQTRFLLIVVFGAVMPLVVVGVWMSSRLSLAGERLLRDQLAGVLDRMESGIAERWDSWHGELLLLAENDVARAAVVAGPPAEGTDDAAFLHDAFGELSDLVERAVFSDSTGTPRWSLARDIGGTIRIDDSRPVLGVLPGLDIVAVALPVTAPADSRRIGTMTAFVHLSRLVDVAALTVPDGGSAEVTERATGRPLLRQPAGTADTVPAGSVMLERESAALPVTLRASAPLAPWTGPLAGEARSALQALGAIALLSVLVAVWLTRDATRTLRRLVDAADAVAAGDLDRQVETHGADDLGRVAHAFNSMTRQLRRTLDEAAHQQALAAVGEFAAELAHEIRNPLSSVRLDLQRIEEQFGPQSALAVPARRALNTIERLNRTVTGALGVARGGRAVMRAVSIGDVLDAAVDGIRAELDSRAVQLERADEPLRSALVDADVDALTQLFINIVMNAAESVGPGGRITVAATGHADTVTVMIRDHGPGLGGPASRYASSKKGGTGLGLPIARRIADAHGGKLELESTPGAGTTVSVTLPTRVPAST